ncbi:hypothetical protein [Maribellus maritimus]|uniref:hypothetical protein n=1 Tax=Maribellus maritimus TaxID=2870838 RepID=UPI001EEB1166|nr:hypothetical protein [Maribellus maritimus]MCG6186360.1 hypothetical protein [Maribellus maritimus]
MNKKSSFYYLVFFLSIIFAGCNKEKTIPPENQTLNITKTSASDCKNETKSTQDEAQYIELSAVNENQLKVIFANAVLNCCPGEIVSSACIEDSVLKVTFVETPPGGICDCICPYDLECIIDEMENREYEIEIFAGSNIPNASFSFTFSSDLSMKYDMN